MYAVPGDYDESSLNGELLVEIACNANQMRLVFDSGIRIVLEGDYVLRKQGAEESTVLRVPISDLGIFHLIEHTVKDASLDESRKDLTLVFSNDDALTLLGDAPYECYTILMPGRQILI